MYRVDMLSSPDEEGLCNAPKVHTSHFLSCCFEVKMNELAALGKLHDLITLSRL